MICSIVLLTWTLSPYVGGGESLTGIDLSAEGTADDFTCLQSAGVDFIITQAWYPSGSFDNSSLVNLKLAKKAGITENGT